MSGIRVGAISRPRRLTNFRLRFANATLAKRPDTSPDTCSVTSEDTNFSSSISTTRSRFKIDANKRFTAICKIADLLHSATDKSDVESLHSLAEIFLLSLKNVLLSLKRRSSQTRSVDFVVTYRGVVFFGRMFASHVRRVTTRLSATQLTDAFQSSMQALDLTIGSLNTLVEHTAAIVKILPDVPGDSTLESTMPPSPAIGFPSINDTLAFSTESSNVIPESTLPVEPAADVSGDSVPPTGTRSKKRSLSRLVSGLSRKTVLRSTWSNTISSRTITIPPLSPHADVSSGNSSPSILVASSQPGSNGSGHHAENQASVSLETDTSGQIFDGKPSTLHNDPPSSEGESAIDPFPSAAEACFSPSGVLRAASLVALVHILTSKEDPEFNALFFLSFRFFSKPLEVFNTLIAQYGMNPPEDLGPAKSISWEKQARVVKIRIAKVFLLWLRLYWRHEWDSDVVEPLRQFALNRPADDPASVTWPKVIKKLRDNPVCTVHRIVRMRQNLEKTLPSPHCPKPFKLFVEDAGRQGNFDEVDILHFHSLGGREELARQLCLAASELFRSFDPEDTVKYWKDGQNKAIGEKISRLFSFENALAYWVSKTIVIRPTARSRAEVLECFIEVAQRCVELRNFSSACSIFLGVNPCMIRLPETTQTMSEHHRTLAIKLESLFDPRNRKVYRSALASQQGPAIPLLTTFKHDIDICFSMRAVREHPEQPGKILIDLERYRVIERTIRAMELCHAPYKFEYLEYIHRWLQHNFAKVTCRTCNENLILLDELSNCVEPKRKSRESNNASD